MSKADEIRGLIVDGQLEAALDRLDAALRGADADASNQVLLQRSRVHALRRSERSGTISEADAERQWNRLRLALLEMVDELPPEAVAAPATEATPRWHGFLSYRRLGGAETVRLLRTAAAAHGQRLFLDVEDLGPGRFGDELLEAVRQVSALVPVLSPHCLERAHDPDDWFAREIRCALQSSKKIVPVRMPGFSFPSGLPDDLNSLQGMQSVSYSHEYFEATVVRLVGYLRATAWPAG